MNIKVTNKQGDWQPILIKVKRTLQRLGLAHIQHQRLSIINNNPDLDSLTYQGLTCVKDNAKAQLIKWSLMLKHDDSLGFAHEINALLHTMHAQTVPLIWQDRQYLSINQQTWLLSLFAMPYMQHGDVKSYLKTQALHNDGASFATKQRLIVAMAHSLHSLHQIGWIHGDIKPSNFLIDSLNQEGSSSDITLSTLLCDFSHAMSINQAITIADSQTTQGTPAYLAPECWQGKPISVQSDIYAFGISMYHVITGKKPFISPIVGYKVQASSPYAGSSQSPCAIEQHDAQTWIARHLQSDMAILPDTWQIWQPIYKKLVATHLGDRYCLMQDVLQDLEARLE